MATVCMCANCKDTSGIRPGDYKCPLYCKFCSTKEKRDEMVEENRKLAESKNEK